MFTSVQCILSEKFRKMIDKYKEILAGPRDPSYADPGGEAFWKKVAGPMVSGSREY